MNDEQLTLAVARALGLNKPTVKDGYVKYMPQPNWPLEMWDTFDPLTDPQWAVPMDEWLVEHGCHVFVGRNGVYIGPKVETPIVEILYADYPTKAEAMRRCRCEAVAQARGKG